ncbi:MAG: Trm112 family protein, partial [Mesorhizobium sp.]
PVRDGIPIMLPSEARSLPFEDGLPPRLGGPS